MNDNPLDALLMKLSSGDALAVEQVFLTYEPYLRKIVRRRLPIKLRTKFDSTDIVQSIWVDLLRDVRDGDLHFADANHLRAFLIRVTCNRFNDRFRRNRLALEKERPLTGAEGDVFAASHQATPSDIVQAEDLWNRCWRSARPLTKTCCASAAKGFLLRTSPPAPASTRAASAASYASWRANGLSSKDRLSRVNLEGPAMADLNFPNPHERSASLPRLPVRQRQLGLGESNGTS